MKDKKNAPANIDQYIERFPEEIQIILSKLRAAIKKAAPQAVERISYQMPAFYFNGNLVYFAAFKNHIGFFPTSSFPPPASTWLNPRSPNGSCSR